MSCLPRRPGALTGPSCCLLKHSQQTASCQRTPQAGARGVLAKRVDELEAMLAPRVIDIVGADRGFSRLLPDWHVRSAARFAPERPGPIRYPADFLAWWRGWPEGSSYCFQALKASANRSFRSRPLFHRALRPRPSHVQELGCNERAKTLDPI